MRANRKRPPPTKNVSEERRDRRQFKALPYYSPNQFPPPPSMLPKHAPEYKPLEPPAQET